MLHRHCMGENGSGCRNADVKCFTPGVTAAMASRHAGTARAAWRARMQASADGYRHSSSTVFKVPTSVNPK